MILKTIARAVKGIARNPAGALNTAVTIALAIEQMVDAGRTIHGEVKKRQAGAAVQP